MAWVLPSDSVEYRMLSTITVQFDPSRDRDVLPRFVDEELTVEIHVTAVQPQASFAWFTETDDVDWTTEVGVVMVTAYVRNKSLAHFIKVQVHDRDNVDRRR